ncbi:MAG: flagellar motor stator protein MotA [candidate division Zixibacteria bacterium HGW-Zixibacteria-1]|nr:MAG: flagellar motor stator protein MotA [candidate division Zixibacteria bacterium HGW-Zixibacteria-1]
MLAIIGILVVAGAVLGGYMMEKGHLMVLMQPAEFLIIGGAALGSLLIGSPVKVMKSLLRQLSKIMGSGPGKQKYIDLLVMMYELFNVARKDGLVGLESHVERPEESPILTKYPYFIKNSHALHFLSDTMRLIIMGGIPEHDLDAMLDMDLETHHHENLQPSSHLNRIGDALPGLGIVAAVLGVVITMGAIGGPPEVIGHKVAAALVGTFLGVLLSYGFVQPLAVNLQSMSEEESKYYICLKQGLLAFHKGFAASIAVEFARRVIPSDVRPGFIEVEEACRGSKK